MTSRLRRKLRDEMMERLGTTDNKSGKDIAQRETRSGHRRHKMRRKSRRSRDKSALKDSNVDASIDLQVAQTAHDRSRRMPYQPPASNSPGLKKIV